MASSSIAKKQKLDKKGVSKITKEAQAQEEKLHSSESESESVSDAEANVDDSSEDELNDDDEVNLDEASSSEDEESEEEIDADDREIQKLYNTTKPKKSKHDDGTESFSSAVNAILGSHLKAHDRADPILFRQKKKLLKQKEDEKLEQKARRLINAEKKLKNEKSRVKNLLPSADAPDARAQLEYERKMKKTAQRGVIKLFNAILSSQDKSHGEAGKDAHLIRSKKEQLANETSKEKFLDMVKAAK